MSMLPADTHRRLEESPERAPMLRRAGDPDRMNLPPGKTCADCWHFRRCNAMFGHIAADEQCDRSPSRFHQAPTNPAA